MIVPVDVNRETPDNDPKTPKNNLILPVNVTTEREEYYKKKAEEYENLYRRSGGFEVPYSMAEKYVKRGLSFNPQDYASGKLDRDLAETQSGWEKAFNALGQTVVSELALGSAQGFADLFDFVGSKILHIAEDDYQNPVSAKLEEWQEEFKNNIAPIYTTPGVDIFHGGFKDFGWWMNNIPSIASSITLLVPARATTAGISALGKLAKVSKGANKIRRWASGINKVENAKDLNKFGKWVVSSEHIAKRNMFYQNTAEGFLMRTMENYQEARDVHKQTYESALDTFSKLSDEEFQEWTANNAELFDDDVDLTNRDSVAKAVAKKAADRTFTMDFSNVVFDIMQLYGLRNVGKGVKQLGRFGGGAGVQAAQRASIAEAAELGGKAMEQTAKKAGKLKTALQYTGDFVKGNAKMVAEESTEGIEEIVNYIAQQEGLTYGKALLEGKDDNYKGLNIPEWAKYATLGLANIGELVNVVNTWTTMQNPLGDYWDDAELQESAFWGFLGGMVFGAGGSAINKAQLAHKRKQDLKALEKEDPVTKEKVSIDEKIKELVELADSPDAVAAKTAIKKRSYHLQGLKNNIEMIESGRNPYAAANEQGVHPQFKSAEEKEMAKQRALDDYQTELVLDSMFSGTYDMLMDYWKSDGNAAAMVSIFNKEGSPYTEQDARRDIDNFTKRAESIKRVYDEQSSLILSNVEVMNTEAEEGYEIPLGFVQNIARNNVRAALAIEEIDERAKVLEESIADQEHKTNQYGDNGSEQLARQAVRDQIHLNHLISLFSLLDMQRKALEKAPKNWNTQRQLQNIKKQQLQVAKQLVTANVIGEQNATYGTSALMAAISHAAKFNITTDKNGNVEQDAMGKPKFEVNANFELSDAEIIKQLQEFVSDPFIAERNTFDEENPSDSIKLARNIAGKVKQSLQNKQSEERRLENQNAKLVKLYKEASDLQLTRAMYQTSLDSASTMSGIRDQVEYMYNRYNAARQQIIKDADDTISSIYEKYSNKDADNRERLREIIMLVYNGRITEAQQLAESFMSKEDATKYIKSLQLAKLRGFAYDDVYDAIMTHLNIVDVQQSQGSEKPGIPTEENSSTSENPQSPSELPAPTTSSQEQGQEQNGQTTEPTQPIAEQQGQNLLDTEQLPEETKPKEVIKLKLNFSSDGAYKGASQVRLRNGRGYIAYVLENGNVIVEARNITTDQLVKLINAGLVALDEDVDVLNDTYKVIDNPVFENRNGKYILVSPGRASKTDGTENKNDISESSPVEENNDIQEAPASPEEAPTPDVVEPTPEPEPEEAPTPVNPETVMDDIADDGTTPINGEQASSSSTGENAETESQPQVMDDSEDGVESALESNIKRSFDHIIATVHGKSLYSLTIDEFNEFLPEVVNFIYENTRSRNIPDEQVAPIIEAVGIRMKEAITFIQSKNNEAQKSAAALGSFADPARREELLDNEYGSLFDLTVTKFLDIYVANTLLPKVVEGGVEKSIVSLEDILRICNNVYDSVNGNVGKNLFGLISAYLSTPEAQAKYKVIDSFRSASDIIRDATNSNEQKLQQQETSSTIEEVDVRYFSRNPEALKILQNLKVGEPLEISVEKINNRLNFVLRKPGDSTPIGRMPIITPNNNGVYSIANNGWVTDVTRGQNNQILSRSKDIIEAIFQANTAGVQACGGLQIDLGTIQDKEALKQLLIQFNLADNADNRALLQAFRSNPVIESLAKQSIDAVKNHRYNDNVLFVKKDGDNYIIDYDRVFDYLARIYNYTLLSGNSNDVNINRQLLSASLNKWFTRLFNTYDNLYSVYANGTTNAIAKVERVSEGELIRPVDNTGAQVFSKPTDVLVDTTTAQLGIVTKDGEISLAKDGVVTAPSGFGGRGNTLVCIKSNNPQPDYARARGSNLLDADLDNNPVLKGVFNSLNSVIRDVLVELHDDMAHSRNEAQTLDKLKTLLGNIFDCKDGSAKTVSTPLFRTKVEDTNSNFRVYVQDKNDYKGVVLEYWANGKPVYALNIYSKTKFDSVNISWKIDYLSKQTGAYVRGKVKKCENPSEIISQILSLAKHKGAINIAEQGIASDYNGNPLDGFFSRDDDGKVHLAIKDKSGKGVDVSADSYNELLINNNLVAVNVGKNDEGKNFENRGKTQMRNQTLYVSLQTNKQGTNTQPTKPVDNKVTRDIDEITTDTNTKARIKESIETNHDTVGIDIFKAALGEQEYQRFLDVTQGEFNILESLLPRRIDYHPEINYFNEKDGYKGVLAYVRGNRTGDVTYTIFDDDGTPRTGHFKPNEEVLLGSRLLNALSDRNLNRRKQAVRKLIHERLHEVIQEDPSRRDELLSVAKEVYDEFIEVIKDKYKALDPNDNSTEAQRIRIIVDTLQPYSGDRLYEEFLVETLTNSNFATELNAIEVEGETDNGKDSLFSRILKAIAKFFGWEIKDNSLYRKEVNMLANIMTETKVDESLNSADTTQSETATATQEAQTEVNDDDPYAGLADDYEDEEGNAAYYEEVYETTENKSDVIISSQNAEDYADSWFDIKSLDGFTTKLPDYLQNQFMQQVNSSEIRYKCN